MVPTYPSPFTLACACRYVSVVGGQHTAEASVAVPMIAGYAVPKQGHLMLNENVDEMVVMWVTNNSDTTPQVQFSTAASLANRSTATGSSLTYTNADLCNAPGNVTAQAWFFPPGYQHKVPMFRRAACVCVCVCV